MLPTISGFIRRALKKAGFGHIPVISINLSGLEGNPGFKITPSLALRGIYAAIFGDIFMKCVYRMRPYEAVPGSANAMHEKWKSVCKEFLSQGYPSRRRFKQLCREIIEDFDNNLDAVDADGNVIITVSDKHGSTTLNDDNTVKVQ